MADFQVPIALGTQTGGSTIRPGSFNGVYALKPTWGAVSREGQKIYSMILDTLGLYARSVDDLQLLAEVFALKDDEPSSTEGKAESGFTLKGAKFALVKTVVWPQVGPGTAAAMEKASKLLKEHGAEVEELDLPSEFDELPAWHRCVMTADGRTAFLPEHRIAKGKLDQSLIGHVENVHGHSRADQLKAFDGIAALRPKIDEIADRYAAIIAPSVPDEAPEGIDRTGSAAFCGMWTALHVPVINIPGFQGLNGLPIGLSLISQRYRDQHLLAVSKEVGEVFEAEGGWQSAL